MAHRYPGEGGVYLWAKEVFGDFHGFLSGWCYWTNNMMYVPTVMLYFVGVSVFVLGAGHEGLADNRAFALIASVVLLTLLVVLNVVGLGVGKWINNLGGIGTFSRGVLADGARRDCLREIWHEHSLVGFPDSGESAIRAEFVRRDLFWAGGTGTGVDHGRRNRESAEDACPVRWRGAECYRVFFTSERR